MAAEIQAATLPSRPAVWNDPVYRAIFFQVVFAAILVFVGYVLVNNTLTNMEERGITSGFDFLGNTAGFSIQQSLIEYSEEDTYGRALVVSLLNTLLVAFVGIILATVLGFVMGVARLSSNFLINRLATVYIEVIRNVPLLLQIFFWYFAVLRALPHPKFSVVYLDSIFLNNRGLIVPNPVAEPGFAATWIALLAGIVASIGIARWARKRQDQTGQQFPVFLTSLAVIVAAPVLIFIVSGAPLHFEYAEMGRFRLEGGLVIIPEFAALTLALVIYTAAFIAEIVRAGIQAVNRGQTEASYALGLSPGRTLWLVVIPQAMRVIIPPLTSQYLNLTKNSSLAAAIAYPDIVLVFAGTALMQTGQAVEIIAITMGFYLLVSLVISMFMNWYNKKMALVER